MDQSSTLAPNVSTYPMSNSQKIPAQNAVRASDRKQSTSASQSGRSRARYTYDLADVLGTGSFGVVSEAICRETGERVAIKKVLQDPRYKNRELDMMKVLRHTNCIELKDYFYTEEKARTDPGSGQKFEAGTYLNVVMDYIPETCYRVMKNFIRSNQQVPMLLIKLYAYQMCRGIGYLHSQGICHRDIKPQNLLVDSKRHILKVCDLGSAKRLVAGEASVSYICSRYYRAPELMLGATEYTNAIDVWSIGCVVGELMLGRPLFPGETSVDQLVKIIQTMGTPTRDQMGSMNPSYTEFKFPDVKCRPWAKVFPSWAKETLAFDFLTHVLRYEPELRVKPHDALALPFFDELRDANTRLPSGGALPALFDFSEDELKMCSSAAIRSKLVPEWYRKQ